ncbi:M12 family metallopeptidase [Actinoplanes sp. NPDC048796]|uniref:M12 family metallopeptidase n=1 Tax=unclassified Actinoplanes TaxID=2626549 RepID=UPI0033E2721E
MEQLRYCAAPPRIMPVLPADMPAERRRAIVRGTAKWANGTKLRYAFMESGRDDQKAVVRESFAEWKGIGIGLDFAEVSSPAEAEVRIGFEQGDGSWSYLGRDVLQIGQNERTMNFGWDLTTPYGRTTARHEIGHTLGMPHEHQNPNAGIVWDDEAVYAFLGGPPNNWPRETTFHNVLRKLDPAEVEGSDWDPESVMEYSFPSGLVISPEEYKTNGIRPPGSISKIDQEQVLIWYPGLTPQLPRLTPFQSTPMSLKPGEQFNAEIVPEASREYSIGTFGAADVVLVLFEEVDGELRYLAGDDDSGEDRNALIDVKLFAGRRYVVRVRLYYSWASGESAVMYW